MGPADGGHGLIGMRERVSLYGGTKLGLRDRVQGVVFAYEIGLVQPGDEQEQH